MGKRIGGLLLGCYLLATHAVAQDSATDPVDEVSPAVDVSAAAAADERQDEIEELEPGVTTEVLVADSRPAATTGGAIDELDLGRTEITGNQELPTVLYIVPWQKSDPGDMMARPGNSLLDEVLAPVDRGEFVRQVDYYGDLFEAKEEQ